MFVPGGPVLVCLLRRMASVAIVFLAVGPGSSDVDGAYLVQVPRKDRRHRMLYGFGRAFLCGAGRNAHRSHDEEADDGDGHDEKTK